MSINSLMNTATSGFNAAQLATDTIGNNIANAMTDGYNRQRVTLRDNIGTLSSAGFVGNGVVSHAIRREYDAFTVAELRTAQMHSSEIDTFHHQMVQIDSLFAKSSGDIQSSIQNFFSSFANVTRNALDVSSRQGVLNSADALAARMRNSSEFLQQLESRLNQEISTSMAQINGYTTEIAALNQQIIQLRGSTRAEPNALIDQRDQLISRLNQLVGVTVIQQDGSDYNIAFAGGLSLVQGGIAFKVKAISSSSDANRLVIGHDPGNGVFSEVKENSVQGALAGLLHFRTEGLDSARNQLGQLALVLADNINRVNGQGLDLSGNMGGNFFTFNGPDVLPNSNNSTTVTTPAVSYSDTSAVQASDYRMAFDGADWQLTRLSDNVMTPLGGPGLYTVDGLTITVGGSAAAGDSFIIKPVSGVMANLQQIIRDPVKIAAARIGTSTSPFGPSDQRNAQEFLNLQRQKLVTGTATLSGAYAILLSNTGNKTSAAKIDSNMWANAVKQRYAEQQKISGVNQNEESVDLERFRQLFAANGKVIQTASTMFDALIAICR